MKFRKKPIVVEAVQFFPDSRPLPEGVEANWDNNPMTPGDYTIFTLEGRLHVSPGDWIITGVKGERYACKPDIFAATYEAVAPQSPVTANKECSRCYRTATVGGMCDGCFAHFG